MTVCRQRSRQPGFTDEESDNSELGRGRGRGNGGPRGGLDGYRNLETRHDYLEDRVDQMEEQV